MAALIAAPGVAHALKAKAGAHASLTASPRTPDGIPQGVTIPAEAGNQAFEFGNCATRTHSTGSWVCTDSTEVASASWHKRKRHGTSSAPKARASAYYRYSFNEPRTTIGATERSSTGRSSGSATATSTAQGQFWQAGTVTSGAHKVRYDFRIEKYRKASLGWEYREAREIVPNAPDCNRVRTRMPTWYTYHSKGYDFYETYWFKIRDCAVSNPDTADGTWYDPRYNTKVYHCVDSTGTCYFKGY